MTLRLGVLVSGSGSNLQAILDAAASGRLDAEVRVVVSDNPGAYGLERARRAGVPAEVVPWDPARPREAHDEAVVEALRRHGVDTVALAGYMRLVTPRLLGAFPGRVLNIHPALLPAFPGLHVHEKVLAHGAKFSGCTVHFVDEGMDTGPIICQAVVPVRDDDTPETLAARILREEHRIYPQALQYLAEGRLRVEGRRVLLDPPSPGSGTLHNPGVRF
ncbi:MAG: phosphoribosylglycinamide formyltransferase [Candidatus Dadabacteria bacterium]|nr:MAG: phosphoribosylglycinamide formyltransferase [Candidatus Dadabacteria bacterium]